MSIDLEALKRDLQSEKQAPFWATAAIGEVGLALVEVVEAAQALLAAADIRYASDGFASLFRLEEALKPFIQADSGGH